MSVDDGTVDGSGPDGTDPGAALGGITAVPADASSADVALPDDDRTSGAARGADPAVASHPGDRLQVLHTTSALDSALVAAMHRRSRGSGRSSDPISDSISDPGSPSEPAGPVLPRPRDRWAHLAGIFVLLALIAGTLVALTIDRAPRFSALDEATHVDYVWQIAHGHLPRTGDPLSAWTLQEWSCHGQANIPQLPACGTVAPPRDYPGLGLQYNAFHPPLYYAVTAGITSAITAVSGTDFFTAARAVSGLWLLAALIVLYLTLRYWRVRPSIALPTTVVLAVVPVVLHASTVVTNDAPAALAGAAAAYLLGRVLLYRNTGWVLPTVLAALATATKVLNGLGMLAMAGLLLLLAIAQWRQNGLRAAWPRLRVAIGMAAAVGVVYLAWTVIQQVRAVPGYVNPIGGVNTTPISGAPISEWLSTLFTGFDLGNNYYLDPLVNSPYTTSWVSVFTVLAGASSLLCIVLFGRGTAQRWTGWALLIGVIGYPLFVELQAFLTSDGHRYFPIVTTRYGMSLIPLALLCLALVAESKRFRALPWLVMSYGLGTALISTAGVAGG